MLKINEDGGRFTLVQFAQSSTLHRRGLILVATSQHYLTLRKKRTESKDRSTAKHYTEELYRIRKVSNTRMPLMSSIGHPELLLMTKWRGGVR